MELRLLFLKVYHHGKRFWIPGVTFFLAVLLGTLLFTLTHPKTYAGTVTMELLWEKPVSTLPFEEPSRSLSYGYWSFEEYRNTQMELFKSYDLLKRVVEVAGIPNLTVEELRGSLLLTPVPDSHLIRVTVLHRNPSYAQKLANTLGQTYVDYKIEERLKYLKRLTDWFRDQMFSLQEESTLYEEDLIRFQEKNRTLTFTGDMMQLEKEIQALNDRYVSSHARRIEKEGVYLSLKKYGDKGEEGLKELGMSLTGDLPDQVKLGYLQTQEELSALLVQYGPEHPRVEEVKRRLKVYEDSLIRLGKEKLLSSRMEWETALGEERRLYQTLDEKVKKMLQMKKEWFDFQRKKGQTGIGHDLYKTLLERWREIDLTRTFLEEQARIMELSPLPTTPFRPNLRLNLMLGFFTGILGALLLTFFLGEMIPNFQNKEDFEALFGISPIAEFPRFAISSEQSPSHFFITPSKPDPLALELFQDLANRIRYEEPLKGKRVFLFTSTLPEEGKTSVVLNLSLTLALQGEKVLLIDGDFLHPQLSKVLKVQEEPGLKEILLTSQRWEEGIHPTQIRNLDIVPLGQWDPQDSFPLPAWERFIKLNSTEYSYLFVDTPPILYTTLFYPLLPTMDGIFVVVQANRTTKGELQILLKELSSFRNRIFFILNQVTLPSRKGLYPYYRYTYRREEKKPSFPL